MKKSMFFALAATVLAASCTLIEADETYVNENDAVFFLGATINSTKTALGDKDGSTYPIEWQAGDQIVVNGVQSLALTAADITDGTSATFGFESTLSGTLSAVSPASAFVTNGVVNLPQNQVYTEGSYDPAAAILFGTGTGTINMTAAVAFLKFDVKAKDGVKKIQVGGLAREALAGMFDTDYATLTPKTGSTAGFVNVSSETPITEGSMIIAIPAQIYSKGLMLMITDGKDNTINKKSTAEFTAEAGKMYTTAIELAPSAEEGIAFSTAPEDAAAISIDHSKGLYDEALALAWAADIVGATYTVNVSLAEDMTSPIAVYSGTSASLKLDTRTLNNIMYKLGKAYTKDVVVYYQVVADGNAVAPSAVKNVKISTEFSSLDDPRDGEFYTVTKVNGVEWLAENLRATKYSDGSAMPTGELDDACFFYENGAYGKKAGAYYGYGNAMGCHYNTASTRNGNLVTAEEKVQGVCPAGWHVPNQNDWMNLMNTAFTLAGATLSANFFTNATGAYARGAFQKMVLRADVEDYFASTVAEATRAGYTNDLGMYFLPVGRYDRANAANGGTVEPSGYTVSFASWNATMTTIWKGWSPFIKFGDGQYYTINQNIHWTYGAAETLRCVKD